MLSTRMKRSSNTRQRIERSDPNMKQLSLPFKNRNVYYSFDDSGVLRVEGDNIHLGDVIDLSGKVKTELCSDNKSPRRITMFATDSIDIDRNIDSLGEDLNVVMAAPKWTLRGMVDFKLSGASAQSHFPKTAKSGILSRRDGLNGLPGLPGKPAGSFLGIAQTVVPKDRDSFLKIIADGGDAADAQNGGNGLDGKEQTYPVINVPYNKSCPINLCPDNTSMKFNSNNGIEETFNCQQFFDHGYIYHIEAKNGNKAGNGGNGGKSAPGGNAGDIILYQLKSNVLIRNSQLEGKDGKPGTGGKGGAGKKGVDTPKQKIVRIRPNKKRPVGSERPHCHEYFSDGDDAKDDDTKEKKKIKAERNKPLGESIPFGQNGESDSAGEVTSYNSTTLQAASEINQYKFFLRANMEHRNQGEMKELQKFILNMDKDDKIRKAYDTIDLVHEFHDMEKQIDVLKKVDFKPFYASLLERIKVCAKESIYASSKQHRKVLNYLYSAAHGRLINLKDETGVILITDMGDYLNILDQRMQAIKLKEEKLSELERSINIYNDLNIEKEKFKANLDRKIEETMNSRSDILSDIANVQNTIDKDINLLIDNIHNNRTVIRNEQEKSIHDRYDLSRQMILKGFFTTLGFVGQAATFLGPVGIAANTFIQGTSSVVQPLLLGGKEIKKAPTEVPTVVTNVQGLVKSIKESRIKPLNEELGKLTKELEKHSSELGEFKKETSEILEDVKNAVKLKDFQKVKDRLEEQKEVIEGRINRNDKKFENLTHVLDNLEKFSKLGSSAYSIYSNLSEHKKLIDDVDKNIEKYDKELDALNKLEDNVHFVLAPILDMIVRDVQGASKNFGGKSQAALHVARWNIKKHLKGVEKLVSEFTKGFTNMQSDFISTIKEFNDSINFLIDLYVMIETYEDQKVFGDFMGNLHSRGASRINITESALEKAKDELEIRLTSNLLLQSYKRAESAFKQFVFPYAHLYFDELDFLPQDIWNDAKIEKLDSDDSEEDTSLITNSTGDTSLIANPHLRNFDSNHFDETVRKIETTISHLKDKLNVYRVTISDPRECVHRGRFSVSESTHPFFTWNGTENNLAISKLLSGKEVTLNADIRLSPIEYDAIKFNKMTLKFRAKNQSLQARIDELTSVLKLTLTHLGDSQYRYNGDYYKITTNSVTMGYHLKNMEHIGQNYEKISNGTFMLSPYASWKFSLSPTQLYGTIDFEELKSYSEEIDLVLEGEARYVTTYVGGDNIKPSECLGENVADYYKPIDLPKLPNDKSFKYQRSIGSMRRKRSAEAMDNQIEKNASTSSSASTSLFGWIKDSFSGLMSSLSFSNSENTEEVISKNDSIDYQDTSSTPLTINENLIDVGANSSSNIHNSNHSLISAQTQERDSNVIQHSNNVDGNGLLMLSNLLVRKLTGEKYQQTALPTQEREERVNDIKQQVFSALRDFENDQEDYQSGKLDDKFKLYE